MSLVGLHILQKKVESMLEVSGKGKESSFSTIRVRFKLKVGITNSHLL